MDWIVGRVEQERKGFGRFRRAIGVLEEFAYEEKIFSMEWPQNSSGFI